MPALRKSSWRRGDAEARTSMESDSSRWAVNTGKELRDEPRFSIFLAQPAKVVSTGSGAVIRETAFPTPRVSAPDVRCNHSRRKPTPQNHSDPGSSGDHARPAPGSAQSTAPNISTPTNHNAPRDVAGGN